MEEKKYDRYGESKGDAIKEVRSELKKDER
jgi:hypothetical protein